MVYDVRETIFLCPFFGTNCLIVTLEFIIYMYRFGANDAAIGQNCSVPPEEYKSNLSAIVSHLKDFFQHVVVISPTPVDGDKRLQYQRDRFGVQATGVLERTTDRAREYRNLAAEVARTHDVLFLDILSLMQEKQMKKEDMDKQDEGEEEGDWRSYLEPDGLHLSPEGQSFVANALIALLQQVPGLAKDALPIDFFPWDQATAGDEDTAKFSLVMDSYEQSTQCERRGQGLAMPFFPVPAQQRQNLLQHSHEVVSSLPPNFEECGVTLTTLSTLNTFFQLKDRVQILGFGSLMSEKSARSTFPHLTNFRIVRVQGYRRVFRHPAAIFFERGIANMETLEISSLSAEKHEGSSFVAAVFSIEGETGDNFLKREEEFDFHMVPFTSLRAHDDIKCDGRVSVEGSGVALMCVGGKDEHYIARWGQGAYEEKYLARGLPSIWNWSPDSGLLPCAVYLRHCYLSAKKLTECPEIFSSFLNDTYLCDRVTTVGEYIALHPEVLTSLPPDSLAHRYSG